MMLEDVARAQQRSQATLAKQAADALLKLWLLLDPTGLAASWAGLRLAERMFVTLASYQVAAATPAPSYVAAALAQQRSSSSPAGPLSPNSLGGIASDGRPLESLLAQPLIQSLVAIRDGAEVDRALDLGGNTLTRIAETQVADAGRAAEQVAMVSETKVFGWVRMINPGACSRCVILSGRWYGWLDGFERHPRCSCSHVPAAEDVAGDVRTNPKAYFESLSRAEQDRVFTAGGAEAIRLGADINQVVNARRGMSRLGRGPASTSEGTTKRGLAGTRLRGRQPRLMPGALIEQANGDRDLAVQLLGANGFIL